MYEMLVGYPPFCSETPHETYKKIIDWKRQLAFPDDVHVTAEAKDLILKLIADAHVRIGVPAVKQHTYFKNFDFATVRKQDGPFVPQLKSITDTSNFPTEEIEQESLVEGMDNLDTIGGETMANKKDLAFVGYTFKKFDDLTRRNAL
jgi:protein-serine/threonine kinase